MLYLVPIIGLSAPLSISTKIKIKHFHVTSYEGLRQNGKKWEKIAKFVFDDKLF